MQQVPRVDWYSLKAQALEQGSSIFVITRCAAGYNFARQRPYDRWPLMQQAIEKFVQYLRYERNASPSTLENYRTDVEQFRDFLTPPGEATLPIDQVDHRIIREFVSTLHDRRLEKSSIARKLAALRTFFKFCMREKLAKQNPARLVST